MVLWPWQKHQREIAELHKKLEQDVQKLDVARTRTFWAEVDQMDSRRASGVLLREIERNGWTEMLQASMKGKGA